MLALNGSGQHHAATALPPGKSLDTHWKGGWVGLRASLDCIEKSRISCPCWELIPWPSRQLLYRLLSWLFGKIGDHWSEPKPCNIQFNSKTAWALLHRTTEFCRKLCSTLASYAEGPSCKSWSVGQILSLRCIVIPTQENGLMKHQNYATTSLRMLSSSLFTNVPNIGPWVRYSVWGVSSVLPGKMAWWNIKIMRRPLCVCFPVHYSQMFQILVSWSDILFEVYRRSCLAKWLDETSKLCDDLYAYAFQFIIHKCSKSWSMGQIFCLRCIVVPAWRNGLMKH
jgi:hypothetical protein